VAEIVVKDFLDTGDHFGHRASRWNPKMRPYIYARRNQIHIIDLKETLRGLIRAKKYLSKVVSQGSLVLFVGTKRQAADPVQAAATKCGMPYVNERWLGGTLTNFRTIRSRLKRLEELEALETNGLMPTFSKKRQSTLNRERKKIFTNLSGIREMNRLPEALVIIDPRREGIAVKEARLLGVKVVALIDTDSDPDVVDLPIPGNDDSIRSIDLVLSHISDAIIEGKAMLPEQPKKEAPGPAPVPSL
jgi:small subunit ribosomal protein S2